MTQKLMVRFDDITEDMNWDLFYQTLNLLKEYGIKPLLGVVPDNQDANLKIGKQKENFYEIIRELQNDGYIIAMHGYYHLYETNDAGILGINNFSEFAGLPYETQYRKLKNAKEIFANEKIDTKIFMAPGHSYDKNTLKALKELGFMYITDGLINKVYKREGMIHIPCTLKSKINRKRMDTICIHTNNNTEKKLIELKNILEQNRGRISDFTVEGLGDVIQYNVIFMIAEKIALAERKTKDRLANSEVMTKYFRKSNHTNKWVKLIKRIVYLPYLLFAKK